MTAVETVPYLPVMAPYKTCTTCEKSWETREDLLYDREMNITGYQPAASSDVLGYVLITHDRPGCGSTLALDSEELLDLYDGQLSDHVLHGSEACRGHCYRVEDISTCDAPCRNAMVREVIKTIIEKRRRLHRDQRAG
jgi:hypothetical protein